MLDGPDHLTLPAVLDEELRSIEDRLEPCDPSDAMPVLRRLFRALPLGGNGDPEAVPDNFRLAIRGYPLWLIKETVAAFIAGIVETHPGTWCPNSAEFGKELVRRIAPDRIRLTQLRRQRAELRKLEGGERVPRSAEMVALGDRRVADLREQTRRDRESFNGSRGMDPSVFYPERVPAWTPGPPLTEEDLAHVPKAPPRDRSSFHSLGAFLPRPHGNRGR